MFNFFSSSTRAFLLLFLHFSHPPFLDVHVSMRHQSRWVNPADLIVPVIKVLKLMVIHLKALRASIGVILPVPGSLVLIFNQSLSFP